MSNKEKADKFLVEICQLILAPPVGLDMHHLFLQSKTNDICSDQCLHWSQELSTGQFHVNGFESNNCHKKKRE